MDILGLAYRDALLITYHEYFKVQVNFIIFIWQDIISKKLKLLCSKWTYCLSNNEYRVTMLL